MKKSLSALVLGLGVMVGANAADQVINMPASSGLTALKFVEVTPGSSWIEDDGVLISHGNGESYLITQASYGDFVLEMDFHPSNSVNGGVYMRCADEKLIKANTCYEANIWDKSKNMDFRTGGIVQRQPVKGVQDTTGKWNHYKLTLKGDTIEVKLNGKVTATLKDSQLSSGFIGFQHKGNGSVQIKNVKLTAL